MRHDDTIRTTVALARKDSPDARAAALRQLVDLSLQGRVCDAGPPRRQALRAMSRLAREVEPTLRNALIDKIAAAGGNALHLRLFRHEVSHHFDRMLQLVRLEEPEWWRFARRAPRHLHAAMLSRRDLPAPVRELLQAEAKGIGIFVSSPALNEDPAGVADRARFAPALPGDAPAATPALEAGRSQVRELIDRIAAFRGREPSATPAAPAGTAAAPPRWTWQSDENAVFVASPDGPEVLVGSWLTAFEPIESPGAILRAVERRVPFRDVVASSPVLAGRWRLSGLPQFERKTGRFTGYWGSAIAIDAAAPADDRAAGLFGTGASSEALATMAHEVRTPLNAIIGFAELIEKEILGEAGESYKRQAGNILKHAEDLLGAFDDLADAARIEQGRYSVAAGAFDPERQAHEVLTRYSELAERRGVQLVPLIAHGIPEAQGDSSVFYRMLSRLLSAAVAAAEDGETLFVVVQPAPGDKLRIVISRPRATAGKTADELLDPSGFAAADGAPILGVGFGLKLVGSLAGTIGGAFEMKPHGFELSLPLHAEQRSSEAS